MNEFDSPSVQGYAMQAQRSLVPTMRQRIQAAVKQAEDQLASAKRAQQIFEAHPDLEELINLLNRGGI